MPATAFRIDPMTISDEEPSEETLRRLASLARAELEAVTFKAEAKGAPLLATATDGSLGTRRVWPSSDIDLMLVPEKVPPQTIEWGIRAGLIVHRHLNAWETLVALRDGYPRSFIESAAGGWVRDPTWMLDGIATCAPVHDPQGHLAELRDFFLAHRFAPEIVVPRRHLLLHRAEYLAREGIAVIDTESEYQVCMGLERALEAVSLIWLEADGRIISHKELDPELAAIGVTQGCPDVHERFRAASGLATLPEASTMRAAARHALEIFSRWLEGRLDASPYNPSALEAFLPRLVYLRHRLWAASLAPARDCWLLLASDHAFLGAVVNEVSTTMEGMDPAAGAAFQDAITGFANALPLSPLPERFAALNTLIHRTRQRFE